MSRRLLFTLLVFWPLTSFHVVADEPATEPAQLDPALVPFVTAGTLIVARGDLSRVDLDAIGKWLDKSKPAEIRSRGAWESAQKSLPGVRRWLRDFRRAGGRIVYAVAFLGDPVAVPAVLIVPLEEHADARAIAGLLVSGHPDGPDERGGPGVFDENNNEVSGGGVQACVINNAVVFGFISQVAKMKAVRPVDRPNFSDGLAALGDAPFKIVASPSIAVELAAGELLPEKLPDAAGGGDPIMLVHSLTWAGVGLTLPPASELRLLIQCTDTGGAEGYSDVLNALIQTGAAYPGLGEAASLILSAQSGLSINDALLKLELRGGILDGVIGPQILRALESRNPKGQAATQP